jgi:4-hydroxy-3-methylbut-2-enyl diphosphate reductase
MENEEDVIIGIIGEDDGSTISISEGEISDATDEGLGSLYENFSEALEKTLEPLESGDVVKGIVTAITPSEVRVDLGAKYDGIIPISELSSDPDVDPEDVVSVGQEIEVFVVRVNDQEGYIGLSKRKLDSVKGLEEIDEHLKNRTVLKGRVTEIVNAGIVTNFNGVRVFIPASQVSDRYVENLNTYLGKEVYFRIIDVTEKRGHKKVVGSIKSVLKEVKAAKRKEFWETAAIGKTYEGVVKSLTNFGAFIDLGGVDGLLHISEISWKKIKHPSEVLTVGDKITVYIKDLDEEKGKVSLGYKNEAESPWNNIKVGDRIVGTVRGITDFGVFVDIGGIEGLVHISELSWDRIKHPSEVVNLGDQMEV